MKLFVSPVTDPRVNMALEEYFLEDYEGEACLVYRNAPCVILGKNQNPYRELNVAFCKRGNIPFYRRISGGGTVYHDLGNLNTAFFGLRKSIAEDLYTRWTKPPIRFLRSLGLGVERDGRNGLEIEGHKISGSAQALKRERFLHHATLLFASDLDRLNASIDADESLVEGSLVNSIRSPVANVGDLLGGRRKVEAFQISYLAFLAEELGTGDPVSIPLEANRTIQRLVEERHKQWHWNVGRSPAFRFLLPVRGDHLVLEVKQGIVGKVYWVPDTAKEVPPEGLVGGEFTLANLLKAGLQTECPRLHDLVY